MSSRIKLLEAEIGSVDSERKRVEAQLRSNSNATDAEKVSNQNMCVASPTMDVFHVCVYMQYTWMNY